MLEHGKRDSTGRTDLSSNKMARRKQNKRADLVKLYRKLSEDEPRGKRAVKTRGDNWRGAALSGAYFTHGNQKRTKKRTCLSYSLGTIF